MRNLLHGDLGTSFRTKQSVTSDLWDRLPATAELAIGALLVGGVGGIALGVAVGPPPEPAGRPRRPGSSSLVGSSLPVFWLGLIVLYMLLRPARLVPRPGGCRRASTRRDHVTGFYTVDALLDGDLELAWRCLRQLMLPAFVLGWGLMGIVSRLVRGGDARRDARRLRPHRAGQGTRARAT